MTPVVPQQSSAQPLLRVRDLDVRYRTAGGTGHLAVDGATFDRNAGQRMALVGQSGSGKTTLALAVTGLLASGATADVEISAGELTFDGKPVVARGHGAIPVRTAGIAMVFQDAMNALDPVRPVAKQLGDVLAGAGIKGRAVRDAAGHWLEQVGLTDVHRVLRSRPDELSGGMRQRVMIAVALAGGPRLLVADEPTSALDASLSRGAMELLTELTRSEGIALLVISHDILLCLEHTDVVGVMYDGKLVEFGESARMAEHAEHPYTRALVQCVPTLADRTRQWLPTLADVTTSR